MYEKLQEKALEIFQQKSNIKALQKSIEAGMKEQARNRRQRVQGSYDYESKLLGENCCIKVFNSLRYFCVFSNVISLSLFSNK